MSEQLSRVKSRQKKKRKQSPVKELPVTPDVPHSAAEEQGRPTRAKPATAALSRRGRRQSSGEQSADKGNTGDASTPSRTETYSSERVRLSKMFVNSLIFLFVLLLGFLLIWGVKGAPPLKELW